MALDLGTPLYLVTEPLKRKEKKITRLNGIWRETGLSFLPVGFGFRRAACLVIGCTAYIRDFCSFSSTLEREACFLRKNCGSDRQEGFGPLQTTNTAAVVVSIPIFHPFVPMFEPGNTPCGRHYIMSLTT
ncbi:UNVERIFIED_CONTAM: hypothetical protein K2H54_024110 [Gekko kuhli]